MEFNTLLVSTEDNVRIIKFNRPKQMNALNVELIGELGIALDEAEANSAVRSIILTGNEKFFCAGADISEISAVTDSSSAYAFSRRFQELFAKIEGLNKPVIVAISGFAFGGGFELMLSCDFRIAAEDAKLAVPEINIGALPAGGGTVKLPRLVGMVKATEMLLLGKPISALEAQQLGLINQAVPKERVLDAARELAAELATKPPLVVARIKRILHSSVDMDIESALHFEAQGMAMISTTEDFKEGTSSFLEKRKPVFRGK